MPMGMPYPKGDMAMAGKPSMSEMMGIKKKPMPPMMMKKAGKPKMSAKGSKKSSR